jgi:hypothetical protein
MPTVGLTVDQDFFDVAGWSPVSSFVSLFAYESDLESELESELESPLVGLFSGALL